MAVVYAGGLLLATGLSPLFLIAVFRPLEMAFPAKKQKFFRPNWFTDFCFFFSDSTFSGTRWCFGACALPHEPDEHCSARIHQRGGRATDVASNCGSDSLSDFCVYWGHRLQHRSEFLWRFHSVHHTAEHLDWLAAHREHPLDTIYTLTLINLPAFVLGFPLETLAGFIAFRGVWAIYIHSNVRLPLGLCVRFWAPGVASLAPRPRPRCRQLRQSCPLMDLMFGTYVCPDHEPTSFGINQPSPKTWLGHMVLNRCCHAAKPSNR